LLFSNDNKRVHVFGLSHLIPIEFLILLPGIILDFIELLCVKGLEQLHDVGEPKHSRKIVFKILIPKVHGLEPVLDLCEAQFPHLFDKGIRILTDFFKLVLGRSLHV